MSTESDFASDTPVPSRTPPREQPAQRGTRQPAEGTDPAAADRERSPADAGRPPVAGDAGQRDRQAD